MAKSPLMNPEDLHLLLTHEMPFGKHQVIVNSYLRAII